MNIDLFSLAIGFGIAWCVFLIATMIDMKYKLGAFKEPKWAKGVKNELEKINTFLDSMEEKVEKQP